MPSHIQHIREHEGHVYADAYAWQHCLETAYCNPASESSENQYDQQPIIEFIKTRVSFFDSNNHIQVT
jgi:hypothetical protein